MSRVIKFRAWNIKGRKMLDLQKLTPLATELPGLFLPADENSILVQYTGITDKNGKEIYEGDVIRYGEGDHRVCEWSGPAWGYRNIMWADRTGEVIGNIYENPELLDV